MATNNGFVMVEHANTNNNFEMVKPPAELKMAKRWQEKAKTKRNTRMRKVTNSWKSKAKRSARKRIQPLSRKPRTAFVGPRGKKNTKLSKTLLKKRANTRRGVVAPRAPRVNVRRASFPEFTVPAVRHRLRAKGQNLRAISAGITPSNANQPSKGKL